MGHNHSHQVVSSKKMGIAILLNIFITVMQIIGGVISGSISLLTDATHNLSDVISLLLSWFTNKLSHKAANKTYTFGYKRAEILSALVNSATLMVIAGFLIVEAFKRFLNPEPIQANIVIIFAFASVLINALSVFLLHNDAKNNMNIKSAYLHLLTDVMTSIAVMIGGLVMKYTGFVQVDSILSFLIALYLIYSSYKILTDAVRILMQAAPKDLDVQSIRNEITGIEGVSNLKNVHIWQLNEKETIFEADVYLNREMMLSEVESITKYIHNALLERGVSQMFINPKRKNQEN